VLLSADLDDLADHLVAVGDTVRRLNVSEKLLDNLRQVLLGDHARKQVQRAQPDRLVLVVEASKDELAGGGLAVGARQHNHLHNVSFTNKKPRRDYRRTGRIIRERERERERERRGEKA
jgi:hypothetical protein